MIEYPRFCFASAPRTGSTWFLNAAALSGIQPTNGTTAAGKHIPFQPGWPSLKISIIRHPFSWLCSYYGALKGGAVGIPVVDRYAPIAREALTVEEFIDHVVAADLRPSQVFAHYGADQVMKLEDMPYAASEFLRAQGGKICSNDLKTHLGPINARKERPAVRHMNRLIDKVITLDEEFCDEYEYYRGVSARH